MIYAYSEHCDYCTCDGFVEDCNEVMSPLVISMITVNILLLTVATVVFLVLLITYYRKKRGKSATLYLCGHFFALYNIYYQKTDMKICAHACYPFCDFPFCKMHLQGSKHYYLEHQLNLVIYF